MRKAVIYILNIMLVLQLAGCGKTAEREEPETAAESALQEEASGDEAQETVAEGDTADNMEGTAAEEGAADNAEETAGTSMSVWCLMTSAIWAERIPNLH